MLQITLLADEFKKSTKGGLSTLNRQLAIQLAKVSRVRVRMLMPKVTEEDRKDAKKYNINIIETLQCVGLEPVNWLGYPPEDFETDIVIGHDVKLGWPGYVIRRSCGAKWIHVVHTDAEELGLDKNYEGAISRGQDKQKSQMKLCEMADLVMTVGPKLKNSVPVGSCPPEKVFNLTPGLFQEFYMDREEVNKNERFDILLFVRGDPEDFEIKGVQTAYDAFVKLKKEDKTYNLTIVGAIEGTQENLMAELRNSPDDPKPSIRRFEEDREELKKLFMGMDLVLMPSKTEGFGLAGLEALSAGVPILVSSNCGLAEALEKIPHGSQCVVEPDDDWARAIKKVRRKSEETRNEEASLIRKKYKEKYSWTEQCKELVKRMKKMCPATTQKSKKEREEASSANDAENRVDGVPEKSAKTPLKRKALANVTNSARKEGTTPKPASKKRKSKDKSNLGNESGGTTPKPTSKKRKSKDQSDIGNESEGATEAIMMSKAVEVAGATEITLGAEEDESQGNDESAVEEVSVNPAGAYQKLQEEETSETTVTEQETGSNGLQYDFEELQALSSCSS